MALGAQNHYFRSSYLPKFVVITKIIQNENDEDEHTRKSLLTFGKSKVVTSSRYKKKVIKNDSTI